MIFAILIILLSVLYIFQMQKRSPKRYFGNSQSKWLAGLFIVLSIVSILVNYFMPMENPGEVQFLDEGAEIENYDLYNSLENGTTDNIDRAYIVQQHKWTYKDKKIWLNVQNNQDGEIAVVIEQNETNDSKIEATLYQTPSILNGEMDISIMEKPIKMSLSGNQLQINVPKKYSIDFVMIDKSFVVKQFDNLAVAGDSSSISFGSKLLYIKVPKGIEVNHSLSKFRIIGE